MGDNWSLAWRTLDAQYWGVPQRRRRIFLVADFRGQCAGEILFKPESVSGNSAEGAEAREAIAGNAKNGIREAIGVDGHNQNLTGGIVNTLKGGRVDKDNIGLVIYDARGNGDGKTVNTLTGDHENRITDYTALAVHQNQNGEVRAGKVANTLNTNGNASGRNAPLVYCIQGNTIERSDNAGANGKGVNENVAYTLNTTDRHATATFSIQGFGDYKPADCASSLKSRDAKDSTDLITNNYSVRRLTPLECERLQGLPDGWTEYGHDGKKISDSARYRGLGNGLAIPCVKFVLRRIWEVA
jgi:DNA (cytosine-5)-methyltransferase 1